MINISAIFIKFVLGIICLVFQINLMGKRNLAPSSPMDQIQNYVLGGIIGGVIYSDSITIFQFLLVLLIWTLLVMIVKYLKEHNRIVKRLIDGKTVVLIKDGRINVNICMRQGIPARELMMKLRESGVYEVSKVKRAVLEQNGQFTITEMGDETAKYPVIIDGQADIDILEMIGKDLEWLKQELEDAGYKDFTQIYLAEYISGKLEFCEYPD